MLNVTYGYIWTSLHISKRVIIGINMLDWHIIKYIFKYLCLIATCAFVGMWWQRYLLDEDMSVIETRS